MAEYYLSLAKCDVSFFDLSNWTNAISPYCPIPGVNVVAVMSQVRINTGINRSLIMS